MRVRMTQWRLLPRIPGGLPSGGRDYRVQDNGREAVSPSNYWQCRWWLRWLHWVTSVLFLRILPNPYFAWERWTGIYEHSEEFSHDTVSWHSNVSLLGNSQCPAWGVGSLTVIIRICLILYCKNVFDLEFWFQSNKCFALNLNDIKEIKVPKYHEVW